MKEFIRTIDKIAVIGMGYVGLPLSLLLARDHKVIGFDVDEARIKKMQDGIPTI
ncbi:MAG: nucleotide sugar dehydrogenase, partial [Thermoplasmataceae archaeon]